MGTPAMPLPRTRTRRLPAAIPTGRHRTKRWRLRSGGRCVLCIGVGTASSRGREAVVAAADPPSESPTAALPRRAAVRASADRRAQRQLGASQREYARQRPTSAHAANQRFRCRDQQSGVPEDAARSDCPPWAGRNRHSAPTCSPEACEGHRTAKVGLLGALGPPSSCRASRAIAAHAAQVTFALAFDRSRSVDCDASIERPSQNHCEGR
jgi:hypothetical protein